MLALGNNEALEKEAAKIARKRLVNEQRKERILNPRRRTIGIDVDALDQQVAEHNRLKDIQAEEDKMEKMRSLEIERILAASSEEEKMMRKFQTEEIKKSWDSEIAKRQHIASIVEPPLDPETCGTASAQKFNGEDPNKAARLKAQKEQMRRWVQEQVSEKADISNAHNRDSAAYSELIGAINAYRDAAEQEEKEMRKYLVGSVNAQNAELAQAQHAKKWDDKRVWQQLPPEERAKATSIDLHLDVDENAPIRKDAFRGYTEKQNRAFLLQNEQLINNKRALSEVERQREFDWAMQQSYVQKALEQAFISEQLMRKEQDEHQADVLHQQMREQAQYRAAHKADKNVGFSKEYFEPYGKSAR